MNNQIIIAVDAMGGEKAPKKIVDGVNFNDTRPMVVKLFQTSIFSCNLIHGPGFNLSKNNLNKNDIMEGLKRIKPKIYVIRKDKIGNTGGLLENKLFLDENFKLLKKFKEYLLYKVPKEFEIY